MPRCLRCERVQSTADMRRSSTPGVYLCRDKAPCAARRTMLRRVRAYGEPRLVKELDRARQIAKPDPSERLWLRLLEIEWDRREADEQTGTATLDRDGEHAPAARR